MDHTELDGKIEALQQSLRDASSGQTRWKDIWDRIREIGTGFKGIRYPSRTDHQAAWQRFQSAVAAVKDAEHEWRARAADQANTLERRIVELEQTARDALGGRGPASWSDIWTEIRSVRDAFRAGNFASRQRREELWTRLSHVAADLKEDRERRTQDSKEHREEILTLAEAARPPHWFGETLAAMITLPVHLAGQVLDGLLGVDRAKEDLDRRTAILGEAWALLSTYKQEMSSADKQHVHAALSSIKEELDANWAEWKAVRSEAFHARQQSWRERMEARIEKLQGHQERLTGVLEHKQTHLRELEEQRDSAYSDSFRERVAEWIQEEESSISSIEEKLQKIADDLDEVRRKLDDAS